MTPESNAMCLKQSEIIKKLKVRTDTCLFFYFDSYFPADSSYFGGPFHVLDMTEFIDSSVKSILGVRHPLLIDDSNSSQKRLLWYFGADGIFLDSLKPNKLLLYLNISSNSKTDWYICYMEWVVICRKL